MVVLFELGSTTLFALGVQAEQDAWVSLLLAMGVGFLMLLLYMKLQKRHPDQSLGEIILQVCGKWIGIPLALFYAYMFLYFSGIVLREFCELLLLSILNSTPTVVLVAVTLALVVIWVSKGIKVIGRLAEISLYAILAVFLLVTVLLLASDIVNPSMLLPVLGRGAAPLFSSDFFKMINFPFGEMVIFLVYWKYTSGGRFVKSTAWGYITAGLILLFNSLMILCTLGPELALSSTIPLLRTVRMINVADIVSNLDVVAVSLLFVCGLFKIGLYFYAGVLTAQTALKKVNMRVLIFGAAALVLVIALQIKNYAYHIWLGNMVHTPYFHAAVQGLPFLLLLASVLKGKAPLRKK